MESRIASKNEKPNESGESGVNSIGMLRNPRLIVVQAYPAQSQWSPVLVQRFPGPDAGRCKMRNRRAVRALRIVDVLQRPTSYPKHQHNETIARCPFSRSAVRPRTNPANKRRRFAGCPTLIRFLRGSPFHLVPYTSRLLTPSEVDGSVPEYWIAIAIWRKMLYRWRLTRIHPVL